MTFAYSVLVKREEKRTSPDSLAALLLGGLQVALKFRLWCVLCYVTLTSPWTSLFGQGYRHYRVKSALGEAIGQAIGMELAKVGKYKQVTEEVF